MVEGAAAQYAPKKFTLTALPAEHGDCLVIDYGIDGAMHRVIVDCGTKATAPGLRSAIEHAPDGALELLVVSHVDADHIAGVVDLLDEPDLLKRSRDVWFNGRLHLVPPGVEPLGPRQGDILTTALFANGIAWNKAFDGPVRLTPEDKPVEVMLDGGAKITLLSPGLTQLLKLRKVWDLEIAKAGLVPAPVAPPPLPELERLERMGGSKIDIEALAKLKPQRDVSAANGSSIAFLFEFGLKKILLGADAHSNVLLESGKKLFGKGSEHVNVLKLPHHGSAKNVTLDLLEKYPADTYVISTDGSHHGHPDDEALAMVVFHNPKAELVFNYESDQAKRWEKESKQPGRSFSVRYPSLPGGVVIPLLP